MFDADGRFTAVSSMQNPNYLLSSGLGVVDPSVDKSPKPPKQPESKLGIPLAEARDGQKKTKENIVFTEWDPIA